MNYKDSTTATTERRSSTGETLLVTAFCLLIVGVILGALLQWDIRRSLSLGFALFMQPFLLIATAGLLRTVRIALRYALETLEPVLQADLTGDNIIGPPPQETIRLVPVRHSPLVRLAGAQDGFSHEDLVWMIGQLPERGVAWRAWQDARLPSGLELTEYNQFRPFPDLLARTGLLLNRGPRAAGQLATTDPDTIRATLRV